MHLKAITIVVMPSEHQSHIVPISRFVASLLLFVFISSLLIPCASMAAPSASGSSFLSQAHNHHHDIEVQTHCDDGNSASASSQLALLPPQNDPLTTPLFHLQPLYWLELIQGNQLVAASLQRVLHLDYWGSLISKSPNPSRYLASYRRQLI